MKFFAAIMLSTMALAGAYLCAKIARMPVLARRPRLLAWGIAAAAVAALISIHWLRGLFLYLFLILSAGDIIAIFAPRGAWNKIWRGGATGAAVAIALCAYGYLHARDIRIKHYDIATAKSAPVKKLRAAMLSDMHLGQTIGRAELDGIIEKINKLNPDMAFLVGDIYDENTPDDLVLYSFGAFAQLDRPVFYVAGNHERYYGRGRGGAAATEKLLLKLGDSGVIVLEDETVSTDLGVQIAGRRDFSDKRRAGISEILGRLDKSRPIIVLDHQPVEIGNTAAAGADLTLSGHTHAGQVFPVGLISGLISTNEIGYGYRRTGGMQTIVTSGAGAWGFPMRVGTDSEIVVIDMTFGE
jgi:predicted MPP superfamily phosphohydrolase